MRCLTLAAALGEQDWTCTLAMTAEALRFWRRGEHTWPPVLVVDGPPHREAEMLRQAMPEGVDLLVVDHYRLDAEFEDALRPWARRILVIDDLADRCHDADLLLDQTVGREAADYLALVPCHCRIVTGSAYALLRREFQALRADALARRKERGPVKRILVTMGMADGDNATGFVLDAIARSGIGVTVDVVLGRGARHLADVQTQAAAMAQPATVHVDPPSMASLMARADLAIGAGGTTSWERCCLGLPSVVLVTADNQRLIAQSLAARGACVFAGVRRRVGVAALADMLAQLTAAPARLAEMGRTAASLCDGRGAERVVRMVNELMAWPGGPKRHGQGMATGLHGPEMRS
jgi:UDP-2,4-diacetamido-2,4,6-trideoxy-beta-L-altropyranose hydrolase